MIDTDERALAAVAKVARAIYKPETMHEWGDLAEALGYLQSRLAQPDQSEPVPLVQATAPERIWLVVSDEAGGADEPFPRDPDENLCWSTDQPLAVCVPYVRADLYTHPDRSQAPGDWVLVPREATGTMVEAGCLSLVGSIGGYEAGLVHKCYDALLAAAPTPPSVPGKGGEA